jgi:hypothetical protein
MNNKNKYRLECLAIGKFSLKEVLPDDSEIRITLLTDISGYLSISDSGVNLVSSSMGPIWFNYRPGKDEFVTPEKDVILITDAELLKGLIEILLLGIDPIP